MKSLLAFVLLSISLLIFSSLAYADNASTKDYQITVFNQTAEPWLDCSDSQHNHFRIMPPSRYVKYASKPGKFHITCSYTDKTTTIKGGGEFDKVPSDLKLCVQHGRNNNRFSISICNNDN